MSTPSLSDGCTTATFSWSAPDNGGLAITKYGWQYSTNNGSTWSSETETTSTSADIDVNNNTNSYIIRVRAYNILGWGDYSNNSSASTAWSYTSYSTSSGCTACDCGSRSRTCYRYTRSGCTTLDGQDCGACGDCSDSYAAVTASGTYNGEAYTAFTPAYYAATYFYKNSDPAPGCGCDSYYGYSISYCSSSNTYNIVAQGCIQWTPACGGS